MKVLAITSKDDVIIQDTVVPGEGLIIMRPRWSYTSRARATCDPEC